MSERRAPRELPKRKKHPDHYESPIMDKPDACAGTLPAQGKGEITSDVLGSYTGTDADDRRPEQDPDDL